VDPRLTTGRTWALGVLLAALAGVLYVFPTFGHFTTAFPGHRGDPTQYMWYLGLFWHALRHGGSPFYTALQNYPRGLNLMWNTSVLAEALLLGPVTLTAGASVAYNVWFFLDVFLAGVLGLAIGLRLGLRPPLALLGGLLTALLPYTTTQGMSHVSLITTAPLLGLVLLVAGTAKRPPRRPFAFGAMVGLLVALQFYTLLEVWATAVLAAAIALAWTWALERERLLAWWARLPKAALASALVVAAVVIAPGLLALVLGPARAHGYLQPPNVYVVDLWNLVIPTKAFLIHPPGMDLAKRFTGNFAEDNGYLGLPFLVTWILLWRRTRRDPFLRVALPFAATMLVLSLGSTLHFGGLVTPIPLPWALFDHLPLIHNALPARLALYTDLAAVFALLRAVDLSWASLQGRWRTAVPVLLGLVLLTWLPRIPYLHTDLPPADAAFRKGTRVWRATAGQPALVLTVAFPEAMEALVKSDFAFPVVNVYGHSDDPPEREGDLKRLGLLLHQEVTEDEAKAVLTTSVKRLHPRRLIFFPEPWYGSATPPAATLLALNETFGPPIAQEDGVLVWQVDDP
jgi:hypothetical protein